MLKVRVKERCNKCRKFSTYLMRNEVCPFCGTPIHYKNKSWTILRHTIIIAAIIFIWGAFRY